MKYLSLNVSLGCTSKFLSIHHRVGTLEFLNSVTFMFCQMVRLLFQAWYVSRRWGAYLWCKNFQFSRKEILIFMQDNCVSLSAGNTISKVKWGYKLQSFTRCRYANVNKFLMGWEFKSNLPCLLNFYNRYWNYVHTKHGSLFSILVSKQKQARE